MSKGSKKRKGSELTPPKTNPASNRRKLSIDIDLNSVKMAANTPEIPEQPDNKPLPWKTNWARTMAIEIIDNLKLTETNIPDREQTLIRVMLDTIEDRVNTSLEFMHQTVQTLTSELSKVKKDIQTLETENITLKQEIQKCNKNMEEMEDAQVKAELYSRRSNLQITGPGISKNEIGYTQNKLRQWFRYVLNTLGCKHEVPIERIHWLGGSESLIIRFRHFSDRQDFWNERGHFSSKFRNMFVSEDFPHKVVEARKTLLPICKEAKTQMPSCDPKVIADKLVLSGKSYKIKDLDKLPNSLQPIRHGYKESDDAYVFFTKRSALSNHSMNDIKFEGRTWTSVEQYWMYRKAKSVDDDETMNAVLQTNDPVRQKALGRNIRNLNMTTWKNQVPDIMYPILLEKFKQNEGPRKILLETGSKRIGEATTERYWGIGRKLSDPQVLDVGKWSDDNIVGKLLEKVRTELTRLGY